MFATSTKKQSLMPTGPLRRKLRAAGHKLRAVVQIGKEGPTPAVIKQLGLALLDHELVKVKIGTECPQDRLQVAQLVAAQPQWHVAQILGRTLLVYSKHPENPKYE